MEVWKILRWIAPIAMANWSWNEPEHGFI